jgi:TPR repeat protein
MRLKIFLMTCLGTAMATATATAQPAPQPNPLPSPRLQQALSAQTARAQSGTKDVSALIADLRRIAPEGDPVAQFLLATLILNSEKSEAMTLLKKSAAAGCKGAAGALGTILAATDDPEARSWVTSAARDGDTGAQLLLSAAYRDGMFGVSKDPVESFAWATVAQTNAPTPSMRQAAANAVAGLLVGTPADVLDGAGKRAAALSSEIPRQPFYLCGFSLP